VWCEHCLTLSINRSPFHFTLNNSPLSRVFFAYDCLIRTTSRTFCFSDFFSPHRFCLVWVLFVREILPPTVRVATEGFDSAFYPSGVGKWVPASAGKAKAGMVHSVSGCTRCVQVKLWDPIRTRAIPERLRGVITTRRYTNPRSSSSSIIVRPVSRITTMGVWTFTFTFTFAQLRAPSGNVVAFVRFFVPVQAPNEHHLKGAATGRTVPVKGEATGRAKGTNFSSVFWRPLLVVILQRVHLWGSIYL